MSRPGLGLGVAIPCSSAGKVYSQKKSSFVAKVGPHKKTKVSGWEFAVLHFKQNKIGIDGNISSCCCLKLELLRIEQFIIRLKNIYKKLQVSVIHSTSSILPLTVHVPLESMSIEVMEFLSGPFSSQLHGILHIKSYVSAIEWRCLTLFSQW